MIYKHKLIITLIKQLFTKFPELFLLSYDYILSMSVSGPLKKHLRFPETKSRSTAMS
jgi:hypothetical protein